MAAPIDVGSYKEILLVLGTAAVIVPAVIRFGFKPGFRVPAGGCGPRAGWPRSTGAVRALAGLHHGLRPDADHPSAEAGGVPAVHDRARIVIERPAHHAPARLRPRHDSGRGDRCRADCHPGGDRPQCARAPCCWALPSRSPRLPSWCRCWLTRSGWLIDGTHRLCRSAHAGPGGGAAAGDGGRSRQQCRRKHGRQSGLSAIKAVIAVSAIVLLGRYILRPLFRAVARTRSSELFMAASLLVVMAPASTPPRADCRWHLAPSSPG